MEFSQGLAKLLVICSYERLQSRIVWSMEFLALWIIDYASAFKTFTITNSFSEKELYDAVRKGDIEILKGLLQNRQEKNPIIVKDEVNGKKLYIISWLYQMAL